jgi:Lrp/AsnC family transcriptional regulator, leucine-responsive regulatory protein
MELDIKDEKILFELEKNARQSNSSIAKSVGLSKDAIGYRIKQLENKNLIRGYRTLIDVSKLGYTLYRIYFKFIDVSETELDKIIEFLKKEKNTWWIGKLDGSWDFAFAYWSKTNKEFYDFHKKFSGKFRKYIKDKLISPIIDYKEIPRRYFTNSKASFEFNVSEKKIEKIDETDFKILRMLSKNSRIPLIEIASKLKVDNMTIFHRIKKLEEKEIILGYKVDVDVGKLGRDFYTAEIDLNDFSKFEELQNEIYSLPEFTARSISIGGNDIEFDLELENSQEYYKIIEKLKSNFPEIREIRYFRVIENYKLIGMPEE